MQKPFGTPIRWKTRRNMMKAISKRMRDGVLTETAGRVFIDQLTKQPYPFVTKRQAYGSHPTKKYAARKKAA